MFTICYKKPENPLPHDVCLIYTAENEVAIVDSRPEFAVLLQDLGALGLSRFFETEIHCPATFLGILRGTLYSTTECAVWLLRFSKDELADLCEASHLAFMPVRQVTRTIYSEDLMFRLYRGLQIHRWFDRFRFCPTCGLPLGLSETELALVCTQCTAPNYPTISPAMIVAITRNNGSELLLVQAKNRTGNWWGLVAGYSEAGESLEQTVEREVREETSLTIQNLQYVDSQSWPFGHSMMLGFTAEYAAGELAPDPAELDNAAWFSVDELPEIPKPPSIGNRLIVLVQSRYENRQP